MDGLIIFLMISILLVGLFLFYVLWAFLSERDFEEGREFASAERLRRLNRSRPIHVMLTIMEENEDDPPPVYNPVVY